MKILLKDSDILQIGGCEYTARDVEAAMQNECISVAGWHINDVAWIVYRDLPTEAIVVGFSACAGVKTIRFHCTPSGVEQQRPPIWVYPNELDCTIAAYNFARNEILSRGRAEVYFLNIVEEMTRRICKLQEVK